MRSVGLFPPCLSNVFSLSLYNHLSLFFFSSWSPSLPISRPLSVDWYFFLLFSSEIPANIWRALCITVINLFWLFKGSSLNNRLHVIWTRACHTFWGSSKIKPHVETLRGFWTLVQKNHKNFSQVIQAGIESPICLAGKMQVAWCQALTSFSSSMLS